MTNSTQITETTATRRWKLVPWKVLGFFATGKNRPLLTDSRLIDRMYKRHRILIMTAITLGYGISYMCRLGLSVVKKPMIDGGIFTADQLGTIGASIFYAYAFGNWPTASSQITPISRGFSPSESSYLR